MESLLVAMTSGFENLAAGEGYTGLYVNPLMKEHEGKKIIDEVTQR